MAIILNVNGQNFRFPEVGDSDWGTSVTDWASAITSGMLQKAGGNFTLLADVDFGASFGLRSLYFKSRSSNIADAGAFRLARTDLMSWRNEDNTANLSLGVSSANKLQFNGLDLVSGDYVSGVTNTATIALDISSSILSATVVAGSIDNSHIATAAAIALTKLAPLAVARAVVTDGSGVMSASAVTATELSYVGGAASNLQTQINNRLQLSGGTLTGPLSLNNNFITDVGTPISDFQAANKKYVDDTAQGLSVKASVRVATTTAGTLASSFENGDTVDGVVLATGNRILIKNQAAPAENGIYVVNAGGAPTRATDADIWAELVSAYVFVSEGTVNASTGWLCNVSAGGTINTTPVTFAQFSSAGQITAGAALNKTGVVLDVQVDNSSIEVNANALRVKPLGITNAHIAAAAAIALSKLASVTASRALVSDGSGVISASAVTATELGYVAGATSSLQTQINGKLGTTITTTGDLIYSSSGATSARLPIGTTGQILTVVAGLPAWQSFVLPNPTVANVNAATLTSGDSNKVFLVDTSATRTFTLPAPAAGLNFRFKDKTGQANTNPISLVRNASEKIEGIAATKQLQTNWGSWHLISDGTDWFLI